MIAFSIRGSRRRNSAAVKETPLNCVPFYFWRSSIDHLMNMAIFSATNHSAEHLSMQRTVSALIQYVLSVFMIICNKTIFFIIWMCQCLVCFSSISHSTGVANRVLFAILLNKTLSHPVVWNRLPFSVRHAETMSSFKFKRKPLSLRRRFPSARLS